MRLVLLGPPGSGKGTQAKLLCRRLDMLHISTGDVLRDQVTRQTHLGLLAKPYMDRGAYAPDPLVIEIVADLLRQKNYPPCFLFDGFPRTRVQAIALDQMLEQLKQPIDYVVQLLVEDQEIIRRITGRRVCAACGKAYHILSAPPPASNVCDACGGEIIQRADDTEAVIIHRLTVYNATLHELLGYYQLQGKVRTLSGVGDINAVNDSILRILGKEQTPC